VIVLVEVYHSEFSEAPITKVLVETDNPKQVYSEIDKALEPFRGRNVLTELEIMAAVKDAVERTGSRIVSLPSKSYVVNKNF
jgi:Tat protein secretion system quality control protein TatD with DNase activity